MAPLTCSFSSLRRAVAFAGDSGNAENTGPHLHFEIHTPDRTAINPYPSLRIAQGFRYANHCGFDLNPSREPDEDAAPEAAWLLGSGGKVTPVGGAAFLGDTAAMRLNHPIVGMGAAPAGAGYWLVAGDGGVFTFGSAGYHGSTPGRGLCQWPSAAGLVATTTGDGYWIAGTDGAFRPYGDATDTTLPAAANVIGAAVSSPVSDRDRRS